MKKLITVTAALALGLGGLVAVSPAYAAPAACGVYASTPYASGNSVKGTGGRTGCTAGASTTVYMKGVRAGLPDTVLAKQSSNIASGSITVSFATPTNGAKYRTQTEDSTGAFAQSSVYTW